MALKKPNKKLGANVQGTSTRQVQGVLRVLWGKSTGFCLPEAPVSGSKGPALNGHSENTWRAVKGNGAGAGEEGQHRPCGTGISLWAVRKQWLYWVCVYLSLIDILLLKWCEVLSQFYFLPILELHEDCRGSFAVAGGRSQSQHLKGWQHLERFTFFWSQWSNSLTSRDMQVEKKLRNTNTHPNDDPCDFSGTVFRTCHLRDDVSWYFWLVPSFTRHQVSWWFCRQERKPYKRR